MSIKFCCCCDSFLLFLGPPHTHTHCQSLLSFNQARVWVVKKQLLHLGRRWLLCVCVTVCIVCCCCDIDKIERIAHTEESKVKPIYCCMTPHKMHRALLGVSRVSIFIIYGAATDITIFVFFLLSLVTLPPHHYHAIVIIYYTAYIGI